MDGAQTESVINVERVKILDRSWRLPILSLLSNLDREFSAEWGFNYEIGGQVPQYYSNVSATVAIALVQCGLLRPAAAQRVASTILRLRDDNPLSGITKRPKDRFAWDTIEGPNVFSTALCCYALLLLGGSVVDISPSIQWLLSQCNSSGAWGYKKGLKDNYPITFYVVLALRAFRRAFPAEQHVRSVNEALAGVRTVLLSTLKKQDIGTASADVKISDATLPDIVCCAAMLQCLCPEEYQKCRSSVVRSVRNSVIEREDWRVSLLSHAAVGAKRKTMYTYNPAFLPVLLRMGFPASDPVVLSIAHALIHDVQSLWGGPNTVCPWRSSDAVIQTFIAGLAVFALHRWAEAILAAGVEAACGSSPTQVRDVFICHASEDKRHYVQRLQAALEDAGLTVWVDQGELHWGDRISDRIGAGVKSSKVAIICLSRNFLKKEWPQTELAALLERQHKERRTVILPLLLNDAQRVLEYYPLIRGVLYREWTPGGLGGLAREVARVLHSQGATQQ